MAASFSPFSSTAFCHGGPHPQGGLKKSAADWAIWSFEWPDFSQCHADIFKFSDRFV